jgi:aminoglycoside phosphotransferase (APT) family kinase protein
MLDALRSYLADGSQITGIRTISAGHSNETYLLEGLDRILRLPPAGAGLMPSYDMQHQHAVMAAVAGHVPVPRVYELCLDESVIGRPFFVMEKCEGESTDWKAPEWMVAGGPELRDSLSSQWCEAAFAIHLMPPDTLAGPARTPAEDAQSWLDLIADVGAPTRLLSLLGGLAESPGPSSGDPTCIHGDVKFANFMWQDGKLTAVLDWEMAGVGEPLTDLGYMLGLWPAHPGESGQMPYTQLSGWWSRSRIVSEWEKATGRSAEGVERHEQLGMAKIGAIFALGAHLYATGGSTDERLGRWPRALEVWLDSIEARAGGLHARA